MIGSERRFLPLLLLICVLFGNVHLQSQVGELYFEQFTINDGLLNNNVLSLCQSSGGILWVGTFEGVCKYDGYRFDPIVIKEGARLFKEPAHSIFESDGGELWFISWKHVFRHNPETNSTENVVIFDQDGNETTEILIYKAWEDRDTDILLFTTKGIASYSKKKGIFVLKSNPGMTDFAGLNNPTSIDIDSFLILESKQGLMYFSKKNETYSEIQFHDSTGEMERVNPNTIMLTSKNDLWLGFSEEGACLVELTDDFFQSGNKKMYAKKWVYTDNPGMRRMNETRNFFESSIGEIFIATNQGLVIWDNGNIRRHLFQPKYLDALGVNPVYKLFEDSKGAIWILSVTSNDYSCFLYDPGAKTIEEYKYSDTEGNIKDKILQHILEDDYGNIWLASFNNGLFKTNIYKKPFYFITKSQGRNSGVLNHDYVYSIHKDTEGILWIGTDMGLNKFDIQSNKSISFEYNNSNIGGSRVGCIEHDHEGNIWIGFLNSQLTRYNKNDGSFTTFRYNKTPPYKFDFWSVKDLYMDGDTVMWIATSNGVAKYLFKQQQFQYFRIKDPVFTIYRGTDGFLWFGTRDAVIRYDQELDTLARTSSKLSTIYSITDVTSNTDFDSLLYAGSYNGLITVNKANLETKNLYDLIKMPNTIIYGVLEDQDGCLWLSTTRGLYKFNPVKQETTRYSGADGLLNTSFNLGGYFKDDKGKLYFGGSEGCVYFDPTELKKNNFLPNLVFTSLIINNTEVKVGEVVNRQLILKKSIGYQKKIVLNNMNNDFSIEFAALHFSAPEENQYLYRLDGYDKIDSVWRKPINNQRVVSYTNLEPGDYTLKVKASNYDGVWNPEPVALEITILPPWWETVWFRALVLIILILGIVGFYFYKMSDARRRQRELEIKVKERTIEIEMQKEEIESQADQLKQSNDQLSIMVATKDKFFSIIAHDLRNPFQAINGMASLIITRTDKDKNIEKDIIVRMVADIYEASKNASELLENLLTWSRTQIDAISLKPSVFELKDVTTNTISLLKLHAGKKNIELLNKADLGLLFYADKDMIQTVVRNLVSNAIKFTPEGGRVTIKSESKNDKNIIIIEDNGVGMEPSVKDKLFRIDKQPTTTGTGGETGTGLGLIICHEFITKNHGDIVVQSEVGRGTVFKISLPVNEAEMKTLQEEKIAKDEDPGSGIGKDTEAKDSARYTRLDFKRKKEPHLVLILDDNRAILESLTEYISEYYEVITIDSPRKALKIAMDKTPEIIISDWVMPEMSGLDFCKEIKTNEATSHIPVILLTGKSGSQNVIKGLDTGADDYIIKPVDSQVLLARIRNLIQSRKDLQSKMNINNITNPIEYTVNKIDEGFYQKLISLIEEKIADPGLNVDILVHATNMSRSSFYRKIKKTTDLSVNDIIKHIRLKKSSELLKTGNYSVAEVVEKTGFNSMSHFSREFKKHFGVAPSKYSK